MARKNSLDYRLDDQVGFLLRVAMQRHTSIFMSKIVKGLTQTQFAALAKSLGVDASLLGDQAIKDSLKRETEQAIACGVFGVPTLIVDGELFWGADAMEFLEAYLANPGLLASNEMKRVGTLPVGAARKGP